jgi:hypothetical protein
MPVVSTLNSWDGRVKANAAIVTAGMVGSTAGEQPGTISIYATNNTDVVVDINGYFTKASTSTLAFYPMTPCRVVDTRQANGAFGSPMMVGGVPREFPMLDSPSPCAIPSNAKAYSLNFTVVPNGHAVGYLQTWPYGVAQPLVSTLNDLTGTVVANAAIVPAGNDQFGSIWAYTTDSTDLVIDINGYFAPPGPGGLSLYPSTPCRVLDTREVDGGQPVVGDLTGNVAGSACAPPANAQAYVLNASSLPSGPLGYLTLWPDGHPQPLVSTLNALDGALASNMAIVPTDNGFIDAYVAGLTQLLLDLSGYFAP